MKITNQKGFTLVELLITIAIMGIILALASPGFAEMVSQNRVASTSNKMLAAINYARTQAIARNARVTICPTTDLKVCINDVKADDWNNAWLIFVDGTAVKSSGTVGQLDTSSGTEEIIRIVEAATLNDKMLADTSLTHFISFVGDGSPRDAQNREINSASARMAYCPKNTDIADARSISISRIGRAVIKPYSVSDASTQTFLSNACS